jgi:hypothetical protein
VNEDKESTERYLQDSSDTGGSSPSIWIKFNLPHKKRERSAYLGFNRKCYRDYPFLIIMGILISSPKYAHRVPAYFLLGLVPPIDDNDDV